MSIVMSKLLRNPEYENNPAHIEAIKAAMRLDPDVVMIGEIANKRVANKLLRAVNRGRSFVNNEEVFLFSRRKARRLAYQWRGSRRGRRIALWLARTRLPAGVQIAAPVEYRFKTRN